MHSKKTALFLELAESVAGVGSWRVNLLENTLYWSKQVYLIHGVSPEEFTPDLESGINFYHPDDRDQVGRYIADAIEKKQSFDFELRLLRPDGSIRWVHSKGECEIDDEGDVIGIYGIFQDMTERRKIEEKLRHSEERYELAVRGSGVGLWDWNIQIDTLYWSPKFLDLVGIIDETFIPDYNEFVRRLHPGDHDRVMHCLRDHLENRKPYDVEYRLQQEGGKYLWVHARGQAIWDDGGKAMRMVGSITDVQSRKEAEATMVWQVKALEGAINGIALLDSDGRYAYMNQAHADIYGYDSPEELYGQLWHVLYDEHNIKLIETEYMPHLAEHGFWHGDTRGKKRDGSPIYTDLGLTGLEGGGLICVCQDATERIKMTQSLRQYAAHLERTNQELDDFAYVASHDLKAPLRAIDNLASWIMEDAGHVLPEDSKTHLEQLRQRINRMERLLGDLLVYSRTGRFDSHVEKVCIKELVHEITDLLLLPEGFVIEMPSTMPSLFAARVPIKQVFLNLISNAVRHHDRSEGRISIAWQDGGDHFEFSVSDDGPGIPAEYHDRIFLLFQTLKPRDEVEGSGIGLSIVKKLLQHHEGTIRVQSEVGKGSTFIFTWPKVQLIEVPVHAK